MEKTIKEKGRILLILMALLCGAFHVNAISLWVGQTYTWDFSGSILGSVYNMNVSVSGGYLSVTDSGFYRNITPTQYFGGTATVTAEWDDRLGSSTYHRKATVSISCYENPVSISRTSVTLSPGETYQLSYRHAYDNQYVGAANAYFSGGNSSFSVSSSGLITAIAPGSGYVNVYSKVSSASKAPSCYVTVRDVEPTGASINNVSVLADQSTDLTVNVSPSNATVKSKQWYVKSGSDVVSISGSRLTGLRPGTATIYCMVNGSVRSNDATVTVTEPKLTNASSSPTADATSISVFTNPLVTYSHAISKGDDFNSIRLSGGGGSVDGTVEISGRELRFLPKKPLKALTKYTLSVPRNAVKNKWGSPAQSDVTLSFTTADLEKATVEMSPSDGSFLTSGDCITLKSVPADAKIYYTLDGSEPSVSSVLYSEPIKVSGDVTVKAFAVREGYKDSDVVSGQYFKSQSEIVSYYPNDQAPLFNYSSVSPHLKLSGGMVKSNNFRRISLTTSSGEEVEGEAHLTNYMIIFVPVEPLENSTTYTMDIPRDAVKTLNGEVFKGFKWSFTTSTLPVAVGMRGDESVFVLSENGILKSRGMDYLTYTPAEGSYQFKDYDKLTDVQTDVSDIAYGYTHGLILKGSAVSVSGISFCGETGTSASIAAIGEVKTVRAGFQTSAIIGEDNSLWMCGRNDFYQLGDNTGTTAKAFVKVADNVIDVALGNGYTLYVDTDNVLWAVGRNHRGQLGDGTTELRRTPVKIMEGVERVYASASGYFSACIMTDNRPLTWGDNSFGQLGRGEDVVYSPTPAVVMNDAVSASLGGSHMLAKNGVYEIYAWGSNAYGQIGSTKGNISRPVRMAGNVMMASTGPNSSLILYNSGKVSGWGRKTHCNFGSGEGNAHDFVIDDGRECSSLEGLSVEPWQFEAKPESSFAFVAIPKPLTADYESLEWSSDNPGVATVDGNGIIRTGNLGEATVTARFTDRFGVVKEAVSKVICTGNPDNSGIDSVVEDGSLWTAHAQGSSIIIENAGIGETYTVYNVQGIAVGWRNADSGTLSFDVNIPGVYMVQSRDRVVKVICR